MQLKLMKDPLFICASLFLFLPLGIFLIFKSDIKKSIKLWMIIAALAFNLSVFLILFPYKAAPSQSNHFDLHISKTQLEVGESASISLINENKQNCDFTISADNDCVSLQGSVLTAEKIGSSTITVCYDDKVKTVPVQVVSDNGGGETVYLTQNGTRYHKTPSHCRKNIIEMTMVDARLSGKTPCKKCY